MTRIKGLGFVLLIVMLSTCTVMYADTPTTESSTEVTQKSLLDFITAGGWVGAAILLLSLLGVALVIENFLHVRDEILIPAGMVDEWENLLRKGQVSQLLSLCKTNTSMISRIVGQGFSQAPLGLPAIRQTMQEQGAKELTKLNQRVGYIGFIASIAPMLGLLGTVTGMINSFDILGTSKGAARPDELAVGIAEALVTTCEGLVVAVPLMFFHNYFRNRLTRINQEVSGACERLLMLAGLLVEARNHEAKAKS